VAVGGVLLAISVFLPWYALTLTATGVAEAKQGLNSVAQSFGNSTFKGLVNGLGSSFDTLVGHRVATLSAHQELKVINLVLLALAAIAIVGALVRLAGTSHSSPARGQLALVGALATACVLFRMFSPPAPADAVFSISLTWGIWVALGSSLAVTVGDLLPNPRPVGNDDSLLARTNNLGGREGNPGFRRFESISAAPSSGDGLGAQAMSKRTLADAPLPALGQVVPLASNPEARSDTGAWGAQGAVQPGLAGGPPAGWYPTQDGRQRYWDGASWTDHYHPA